MSLPCIANVWLRSNFFPTFDEARLGLSRCPFCLLLRGVYGFEGYELVTFSKCKRSFEAPVAAVRIAVVCSVHLADGWVIRGKFRAPKKRRERRWRVNDDGCFRNGRHGRLWCPTGAGRASPWFSRPARHWASPQKGGSQSQTVCHGVQITVYLLLAIAVFLLRDGWSRQTSKINLVSQKQSMLIASPIG
jgi:hypothetical protein